ncbi:MAG: hypothetical protein ACFFD2_07125, partial [Promethearchaeota archaeon]
MGKSSPFNKRFPNKYLILIIFIFITLQFFISAFINRNSKNQILELSKTQDNPPEGPVLNILYQEIYSIFSHYLQQGITLDGNLTDTLEWSDAYLLQLNSQNYPVECYLYFKNNETHLAILCDAVGDTTQNATATEYNLTDHFDIGFDTGGDTTYSDGSEDSFSIFGNGTVLQWEWSASLLKYTSKTPESGVYAAVTFGVTPNENIIEHMVYECLIPLSILSASAGDTIGIYSNFLTNDTYVGHSGWPYDVRNYNNREFNQWPPLGTPYNQSLDSWGTIQFASSPLSSTFLSTGNDNNVILFFSNSSASTINSSDALDFTVPVPTDQWGMSFTNLTFTDLTAPNIYWHLGNDNDDSDQSVSTGWVYMGFNITNYCTLKNFSVKIKDTSNPGNQHLWRVYDASWDSVDQRPEPGSQVAGAQGNFYTENPFAYWEWNDTTSVNVVLDPSSTDNNTFFVAMLDIDFQSTTWRYRFDAVGMGGDGEDEGLAFVGTTFQPWDFELKINLEPISSTPTPMQVSMQVNGSAVNTNCNWNSTTRYTSTTGSVLMNVTAAWPLAYNVSYNCEYDKNMTANTQFSVDSGSSVDWNISWSAFFPSNAQDYMMNLTIPLDWNVINIWNRTSPDPFQEYSSSYWQELGQTYDKLITIQDLTNLNAQDWWVNCSSPNYLTNIKVFRETTSYELLGSNPIINITDIIHVNGTLEDGWANKITDVTNGGNLSIYLPSKLTCYQETNVTSANGLLNFTDWDISDNTDLNGTYIIQITWLNGTEVGMDERRINVIYPTTLKTWVDESLYISGTLSYYIGDPINVTCFYNNTFLNKLGGISTINASYRIENVTGGLWIDWTSLDSEKFGMGYYNKTFDTTYWTAGTYYIKLNINRSWYMTQTGQIDINIQKKPTNLTIYLNQTPLKYKEIFSNETINITTFFEDLHNMVGVPNANVNITVVYNNTMYQMQENGNGNYSWIFDGWEWGKKVTLPYNFSLLINGTRWDCQYNETSLIIKILNDAPLFVDYASNQTADMYRNQTLRVNATVTDLEDSYPDLTVFLCINYNGGSKWNNISMISLGNDFFEYNFTIPNFNDYLGEMNVIIYANDSDDGWVEVSFSTINVKNNLPVIINQQSNQTAEMFRTQTIRVNATVTDVEDVSPQLSVYLCIDIPGGGWNNISMVASGNFFE